MDIQSIRCRGLPVEKYTRQQIVIIYWAFGLYWGNVRSQNSKWVLSPWLRSPSRALLLLWKAIYICLDFWCAQEKCDQNYAVHAATWDLQMSHICKQVSGNETGQLCKEEIVVSLCSCWPVMQGQHRRTCEEYWSWYKSANYKGLCHTPSSTMAQRFSKSSSNIPKTNITSKPASWHGQFCWNA